MIEIGRHLIEVKERVGHGHFLDWVEEEFEWKERAAENYMAVARAFPHARADLPMTHEAMRLLAGPSAPEAARQDAIARAEAGERITKEEARALIVSANLQRRNLTKGQQAMLLATAYPEPAKLKRKGSGSLETEELKFSAARLSQARFILRMGPDDLAPAVIAGSKAVPPV
ncbi:MAG TPA: DUF3102 domain-containing protein [Stellaceae bacterium]|nr:DUF3102 domain-containing protein [Stellaceae bacterium]